MLYRFFKIGIFFGLILAVRPVFAQLIGIPFVESYAKEEYGYGTQNWDIEQGADGLMYFANNEGLLEFDGATWHLFPLPNKTILRSIHLKEDLIYGGGQNELGFYQRDMKGKWTFISLKSKIPEQHQDFEDVWGIERLGETLYFLASEKLFILADTSFQVVTDFPVSFLGAAKGRLFLQDMDGTLYQMEEGGAVALTGSSLLAGSEVRKVIPFEEGFLITTYRQGLFIYDGIRIQKWENEGENHFGNQFINTVDVLDNGDVFIGTGFNGAIIIDKEGQFKYHITAEDGLSNDRVISTFLDRHKNLWLGLDNGISMIRTNSPFARIYPKDELEGAGYDVVIFEDKIYLGNSSGLLYADWKGQTSTKDLRLVQNTNGQVWGLDQVNDQLILSHKEGAFLVDGATATQFYDKTGVWLFQQDQLDSELIFSGNYEGISFFEAENLGYLDDLPELEESSRFIVQDEYHHYWMSHPYRGVYQIAYPNNAALRSVAIFGPEHGLPSNLHNHVFKINGEILVCAEKGVFVFDREADLFMPYEPINQYLGADTKVRRLFEGQDGDIWFVTEKEIGLLDITARGLTRTIEKIVFPELESLLNSGWEKIYSFDRKHVFITTINGFLHYDASYKKPETPSFDIVLQEMIVNKDSLIYPSTNTAEPFEFPYYQNSFLYSVAATEYVRNKSLEFQYFLKGLDEDWTPLTAIRTKEYTNLAPGEYELNIRATSPDGLQSSTYKLAFSITKPWYLRPLAIGIYLFLLIVLAYLLYGKSQKKYKILEQKVDTTVKQTKVKIEKLETEKMQAKLNHKNRELVSATLHLVKKSETILDIVSQLDEIKRKSKDNAVKLQLQKLIRALKNDEIIDEGWDQVMYHFNELHENFFDRLRTVYPSLTPKDLRLCAYLKMNLTTKEMATLMNVSPRGVEASRYRLRKKLNLLSDVNLTAFIMSY